MNEFKIGSVVRLKSDTFKNLERYFTIESMADYEHKNEAFNGRIISGRLVSIVGTDDKGRITQCETYTSSLDLIL